VLAVPLVVLLALLGYRDAA